MDTDRKISTPVVSKVLDIHVGIDENNKYIDRRRL